MSIHWARRSSNTPRTRRTRRVAQRRSMSKACALLVSQLAVLTRAWTNVFSHVNGGETAYIGNAQLNALDVYEAQMCLKNSQTGDSNCLPLTHASGLSLDSGVNADLNSPLKRMIAALSGHDLSSVPQWYCPDWDGLVGACTEPEKGKIFNSQIGVDVGQPCANSLCWNCRTDNSRDGMIVRTGDSNWHVWGYGVTLTFGVDGSAHLGNPDHGSCQPTWDGFYINIAPAPPDNGGAALGAIIGGVAGGICAVVLLVVCFCTLRRKVAKNVKPEPVDPNQGPWDFFFSHKQAESGQPVALVANDLAKRGKTVWLDVNMKNQSLTAMMHGVDASSNFVLVLSHNYFESEYCRKELRQALKSNKNIILCHTEGLDVGAALTKKPAEFEGIGEETSIQLVVSNPAFREVAVDQILAKKKT